MYKPMQNDMFDALLYAAAPYAGQHELEEYASADLDMQLSTRAKRRIARRARRGPMPVLRYVKRAAMIALVVMSLGFASMLSIEAVREALWNAIVEWYEESIAVAFVSKEVVSVPIEILEYREPRGLGEEFVRYEVRKNNNSLKVEYESATVLITYRQGLLEGFDTLLSNEKTVISDITVKNCPGLTTSTITEIGQQVTVVWHDNEYTYVISGNVALDVLLKMAESVQ